MTLYSSTVEDMGQAAERAYNAVEIQSEKTEAGNVLIDTVR